MELVAPVKLLRWKDLLRLFAVGSIDTPIEDAVDGAIDVGRAQR